MRLMSVKFFIVRTILCATVQTYTMYLTELLTLFGVNLALVAPSVCISLTTTMASTTL